MKYNGFPVNTELPVRDRLEVLLGYLIHEINEQLAIEAMNQLPYSTAEFMFDLEHLTVQLMNTVKELPDVEIH